jgi:hypothetical protein
MSHMNLPTFLSMSYNTGIVSASTTQYLCIGGGTSAANSTEANRQNLVPTSGILKNFHLATNTTMPGTGSLTLTIRKNGVDTPIVIVIAASTPAGLFSDTTNSVGVAAGDLISIKAVNSASGSSSALISAGIGIY